MRDGVPNLLRLAKENDEAKFTLFVNMGRAVSRWAMIRDAFRAKGRKEKTPVTKLTLTQKLGVRSCLAAAVLNPLVGSNHAAILRSAEEAGHEIGLHGGMNHATWMRDADRWPEERVRREVAWGLQRLEQAGVSRPVGFSSPGWNGPACLPGILAAEGFEYLADVHDPTDREIRANAEAGLGRIPTNLVGEPGGVGYVENLRARGLDDAAILDQFAGELESRPLAIVYDHPGYVGRIELPLVEEMFRIARRMGFKVMTLGEAFQTIRSH